MRTVEPILALTGCLGVLTYYLFAFAHARLLAADLSLVDELFATGLLRPETRLDEAFRVVDHLTGTIAPAVFYRRAAWIRPYFRLLRLVQTVSSATCLMREMYRLLAYNAGEYRKALALLDNVREAQACGATQR